ncbi:hypothetical protein CLAIMM_10540 [Cladophialophora immunda]|nr:hypothetical protein CLAIMM_10540 [Cladophialophora immunda]
MLQIARFLRLGKPQPLESGDAFRGESPSARAMQRTSQKHSYRMPLGVSSRLEYCRKDRNQRVDGYQMRPSRERSALMKRQCDDDGDKGNDGNQKPQSLDAPCRYGGVCTGLVFVTGKRSGVNLADNGMIKILLPQERAPLS